MVITEECETLYKKLNTFVKKVINRDVQPQIDSLDNNITNFLNNNKFTTFWTDGSGVSMAVNKAIGISYINFNKNVTVSANGSVTIHSAYTSGAVEEPYCPITAIYCPTSRNDVFIYVNYMGAIMVLNRSSSAITNGNVQGGMTWRAKGYPK